MDVKFTPVEELIHLAPIKGILAGERCWPLKLIDTNGEVIYLNVYESEIRSVLKQMSDIVEGL